MTQKVLDLEEFEGGQRERSRALTEMVGGVGGEIMIANWYDKWGTSTKGMAEDIRHYRKACPKPIEFTFIDYISIILHHVPERYRNAIAMRAAGDPAWVRVFEEVTP